VSDDFPVQLATRLIGRPAVCCGVVLPVCPCVGVVLRSPRARHARLVADILARMSRGRCAEKGPVEFELNGQATRKLLLPWNLSARPGPRLPATATEGPDCGSDRPQHRVRGRRRTGQPTGPGHGPGPKFLKLESYKCKHLPRGGAARRGGGPVEQLRCTTIYYYYELRRYDLLVPL